MAGPTAIAYVMPNPQLLTADGKLVGGGNMAVLHLATALGGAPFFGVVAGIAFATILAVVAGPTIAAASATSHDLATFALRGRRRTDKAEVRVFRLTTLVVAAISVLLAIAFQAENVAFLAALAFAVATSTNFPVLILALYWRGTTAVGAMAGGFAGLVASAALIVLGPAVWVKILGYPRADPSLRLSDAGDRPARLPRRDRGLARQPQGRRAVAVARSPPRGDEEPLLDEQGGFACARGRSRIVIPDSVHESSPFRGNRAEFRSGALGSHT